MSSKLCMLLLAAAILTTAAIATKDVYNVNVTNNKDLGDYMRQCNESSVN